MGKTLATRPANHIWQGMYTTDKYWVDFLYRFFELKCTSL